MYSTLDKAFEFDYKSMSLKPVEQLVCIRMYYLISSGQSFSLTGLSELCNCSRQTVYSSVSRLVDLGFFEGKQDIGRKSTYSVGRLFLGDVDSCDKGNSKESHVSEVDSKEVDFSSIKACFSDELLSLEPNEFDDLPMMDVPVDSLLSMGGSVPRVTFPSCAPSSSKRAKARRNRKKRK